MFSCRLLEEAHRRLQTQLGDSLPPELVEELFDHDTSVIYPKDAVIFEQNSPADLMFWMFTGTAKLCFVAPDGHRRLLRLAGLGDLLGNVDFLDSKGRRSQAFEARALTRCSVGVLTRERALKVLQRLDQLTLLRLMEQVNTRWSALAYWYAGLFNLSFRRRLEAVLADLAERFGVQDKRGIILTPELTHGDLAEMVGSSRPMVSRLIGQMVAKRVLARHGKQYIILDGRISMKLIPFNNSNGIVKDHNGFTKSYAAPHAN
jgi:CRP/FNR family cyclic AMP-dependent transcriptional regulator